jgi:hypothetical protein
MFTMVTTIKVRRTYIPRIRVALLNVAVLIVCTTFLLLYVTFSNKTDDSVRPYTVETKVIVHQSVCNEGPTDNITRTSLFSTEIRRRRGEYPQYHHISQILEGPAMKTRHFDKAICKFRQIKFWEHFPHTYVK